MLSSSTVWHCAVGGFNVSNLMGITRRKIDIGKKITFYFLQNVWKCTVFFAYAFKVGCPRNEKKNNFGSNRNKPKQDLFRVCFGLFRETKEKFFRFVSVFLTYIETTETNRTVSKRTETIGTFLKNNLFSCFILVCLILWNWYHNETHFLKFTVTDSL
jgi:hypothetical protein